MAIVEIEGLDKPSSLSSEQSYEQPAIKVAGFYTLRKSLQTTSASPWIILEDVIDKLQEVILGLEKSVLKSTVSRQWIRLLFENN